MKTLMQCVGCRRYFNAARLTAKPICYGCQRDVKRYAKARLIHKANLRQEAVDRIAELETARLERKDTFTPLMGEKLIEMMQRM